MRDLTSIEQERAIAAAAVTLVGGQVPLEGQMRMNKELVKMAVCGITAPLPRTRMVTPEVPSGASPAKPVEVEVEPTEKDWRPLTYGQLDAEYDTLFNARTRLQLQAMYDKCFATLPKEDESSFFGSIRSVSTST
jgi:hypothetical protein